MALCKYPAALLTSDDPEFDVEHPPGAVVVHSGIYRCVGCQREVPVAAHARLPSPSHHAHAGSEGEVRWQLLVFADFRPRAHAADQ